MKRKKFDQKLSLNKKTIANLGNSEMSDALAGISGSWCGNPTCIFECTNRIECPSVPWTNCAEC
jgi:hypothetical protein